MNFLKLSLLLTLFIIQFNGTGQIVLTLDNVPPNIQCDQIWTEQNLDLRFTDACNYGISPNSVSLWPSALAVDLSPLQNITRIEIDVDDNCADSCTNASIADANGLLVDNAGNITNLFETLTLFNPSEAPLSELRINSNEGEILEIRIFHNGVNSLTSVDTPSDSPIVCYPNPGNATDDLHFTIVKDSKWSSLENIDIFNIEGQLIYSKKISAANISTEFIISANDLPTGILVVRFKLGDQFITQKIVRL